MILSRPQIVEEADTICVSCQVKLEAANHEFPDTLWFRFPKVYSEFVTERCDGFAVSLLPLAMALGENLQIRGAISPRLLWGMEEYQRIQTAWKPTPFRKIGIVADELKEAHVEPAPLGVGCTFSGGVDSFYTLLNHLSENESNSSYRISHCVMINGFEWLDADLDNTGAFLNIHQAYEPIMEKYGLQLIVVRTNFRLFISMVILKQSFAAHVTVPALILGRLFSCFLVAGSYRFDEFYRDGSHPIIDHLISTETLETVHDAGEVTRIQKTEVISRWEVTYSTLRVCFSITEIGEYTGSIENCCRCEKCIRTIAMLDLVGKLHRYKTFPKPLRHRDILMCWYAAKGRRIFAWQIIRHAWQVGRIGVSISFGVAVLLSSTIYALATLARRMHRRFKGWLPAYENFVRLHFPQLWIKLEESSPRRKLHIKS